MTRRGFDWATSRRGMNPGAFSPFIDAFADYMTGLGLTPTMVERYTGCARHFAVWLIWSKMGFADIDDGTIGRFAQHRCQCPGSCVRNGPSADYVRHAGWFVRFLAETGEVALAMTAVAQPIDQWVREFQEWSRRHRGLTEVTIRVYGATIMKLLPALGADPAAYDAALVRRVILEESRRRSPPTMMAMTTALRGYLRFLVARGACRPWLDQAVPSLAHRRLSALPRYLSAVKVERLIAACDLTQVYGVRDRAILLLLARLGLRAGDIVALRFDDIDWESGTLRVSGKGRREVRLPLPQDAGDAVLAYLNGIRPEAGYDRIFLRSSAPFRPFAGSGSVSSVVRQGLKRAGITDAPSRGANLLRHSAATGMLRSGATLDAIGAVLRHRSIDTTRHYAKVDLVMLNRIVQPWPGELPC